MVVRRKYVTARRPTAPDKETFREPTAVIREGTMSGMISALSIRRKSFPTTETYMTSLCVQCSFSWWSTRPKQTPAKTPTANVKNYYISWFRIKAHNSILTQGGEGKTSALEEVSNYGQDCHSLPSRYHGLWNMAILTIPLREQSLNKANPAIVQIERFSNLNRMQIQRHTSSYELKMSKNACCCMICENYVHWWEYNEIS